MEAPGKICIRCLEDKDLNQFQQVKSRNGTSRLLNQCRTCLVELDRARRARQRARDPIGYKAHQRNYDRTRRHEVRLQVIQAYGGRCACCGESNFYFLQLDHIKGGGGKHRKTIGRSSNSTHFYRWLIEQQFPKGFRLLCANCNCALGYYGFCPHQGRGKQLPLF